MGLQCQRTDGAGINKLFVTDETDDLRPDTVDKFHRVIDRNRDAHAIAATLKGGLNRLQGHGGSFRISYRLD